jgi:hypothetical protein
MLSGRADASAPGLLLIQIDGLSAPAIERAIATGTMPSIARLMHGGHVLHQWSCGLPSDTLAAQTTLFWGAQSPVPSFEWWDRQQQRRRRAASASSVGAFERALNEEAGPGLLRGGQCHGAAIGGGAYGGTLLPPSGRRTWRSMGIESVRAIANVASNCVRREFSVPKSVPHVVDPLGRQSRVRRAMAAGVAMASRATGHIVAAGACHDIAAGQPVIFVNVVEYDLVAHLAGPRSVKARDALASVDRIVATILEAVRVAPCRYRVVVLSDHGVAPAIATQMAFSPSPTAWIRDEWTRRCRMKSLPSLAIAPSGTILQAWIRSCPDRQSIEALSNYAPGFVEAISKHPSLTITIVSDHQLRTQEESYLVFGRSGGARLAYRDGQLLSKPGKRRAPVVVDLWGDSPFAELGPTDEVEAHVAEFASRPDIGDITCLARPVEHGSTRGSDHEFWAFESQFGAHGGTGGEQSCPFILAPPDALPLPSGAEGAAALHEWLEAMAPER